jgi:adenosylcobinamide-phosphate synthase
LNLTEEYGIVRIHKRITQHMTLSITIILAVLLDHWLGEPDKHHPLITFGKLASALENNTLRQQPAIKQKTAGLLALTLLVLPLPTLLLFLPQQPVIEFIVVPLILYFCIAANSLKQHADVVYQHLINNELNQARTAVGYIVSRQTEHMNSSGVRKATIESVLENGADAVFAPLFWFVIGGPAGVVLYRLSNTLDAMWGYKNQRYCHFGWAAARFDDVLNWIPARLTALSYALLGHTRSALTCWRNQADKLESPNGGPVMTAGAGSLNIQLGGPAYYHGRLKQKIYFGTATPAQNRDIPRANKLINQTLGLWIISIMIGEFLA